MQQYKMTTEVRMQFTFRNKCSGCSFYIDSSESPCYVFVILEDLNLIEIFGEDITIKTDFEKLLPKQDDYSELVELRQALFDALKGKSDFIKARDKTNKLNTTKRAE